MDFTNLDAIEFTYDKKTHIRLYYQTKDRVLRETSFETGEGWFIRSNGIIATNAKKCTPITATRWQKDNAVHIRVYFLDMSDTICEAAGSHTATGTVWISSSPSNIQVKNTPNHKAKAAPGSSLAIGRPGTDDETLRLFYQMENNGTFPIHEIRYQYDERCWTHQRGQISGAGKDCGISAASAGRSSPLRVYYADGNNALRVAVWHGRYNKWEESAVGDDDVVLAPRAPISAVCWYDSPPSDDFRIRVYTILNSKPNEITELAQNEDDWKSGRSVVDFSGTMANKSAVALSRDKQPNAHNAISLFYQPSRHVVEVTVADREQRIDATVATSLKPCGLPTARELPQPVQDGYVPAGYQYVSDGFRVVESTRVIPDGFEAVESSRVIQPGYMSVPLNSRIVGADEKATDKRNAVFYIADVDWLIGKMQMALDNWGSTASWPKARINDAIQLLQEHKANANKEK